MKPRLISILSVSLAILFWSSSFIAVKIAGVCFTPLLLCMVRFVTASALFLVLRLTVFRPAKPERRDLLYIFLTSAAGITVYYALENIGVQMTTASNASLISAAYPAVTALTGVLFYRVRCSKKTLLGIGIAILGVCLLTDLNSFSADSGGYGNALLVFDGFLWAYYNYTMQKISPKMDAVSISYYQTLIGTVLFVPLVFLEHPSFVQADLSAWAAVIYLAAGCTVAALLLYNTGIREIPAVMAAALMNLSPVFGVALSALILSETVTVKQILAGLIILAGVGISTAESHTEQSDDDTMNA